MLVPDGARRRSSSRGSRSTTSASRARAASTTSQGGPFAFVQGLDAVGAWPPIRESHVEMDAAWALYEAWVAIQTGEVDSALDLRLRQVVARRPARDHDAADRPVLRRAAVAVDGRPGRAAGARVPRGERPRPSSDLAEVAAACAAQRRSRNPHAVRKGDVSADDLLAQPVTHDPLRDADIAPITDGAAAVVIAAGDLARSVLRAAGVDPRHRAPHRGPQPRRARPRAVARRRDAGGASRPASATGAIDVAELHAQFSHEELILARGARAERRRRDDQPVGRPARVEPGDGRRPRPHRRGRAPDLDGRRAARRRARDAGPCLQQNLVCVLEGK